MEWRETLPARRDTEQLPVDDLCDDEVCFLVEPTAEGLAAGILEAITDSAEGDAVSRRASHHSTEASSSTRRGPALPIGNHTCAE